MGQPSCELRTCLPVPDIACAGAPGVPALLPWPQAGPTLLGLNEPPQLPKPLLRVVIPATPLLLAI